VEAIAQLRANSCDHANVLALGRPCCLLLSGGVDSALVASILQTEGWLVSALWLDYGQPAAPAERAASQAIAAHYALHWQEAAVEGILVPPQGEIPGRNDLLVATAHSYAPGLSVAIGVHAGGSYPDCSREWLSAWQAVLDVQHEGVVALLAPLAGLPKQKVLALAHDLRVPMTLTYSCETGPSECGECLSCRDRNDDHAGA
jgi:7-cyano-7-deazaguanine synthase